MNENVRKICEELKSETLTPEDVAEIVRMLDTQDEIVDAIFITKTNLMSSIRTISKQEKIRTDGAESAIADAAAWNIIPVVDEKESELWNEIYDILSGMMEQIAHSVITPDDVAGYRKEIDF